MTALRLLHNTSKLVGFPFEELTEQTYGKSIAPDRRSKG